MICITADELDPGKGGALCLYRFQNKTDTPFHFRPLIL